MNWILFCIIAFVVIIDITVGEKQDAFGMMTRNLTDASVNSCDAPIDMGACEAKIPKYAYVKENDSCVQFFNGGCEGNCNRFPTEEDCMNCCKTGDVKPKPTSPKKELLAICSLPPVPGKCLAFFKRYYFNSECKRCQLFIYGGCDGNENNFKSMEECEESCGRNNGTCDA